MKLLSVVFVRQLSRYLGAPATYVSLGLFLALSATWGLHASQLFERSSTDLQGFFQLHPWLYLLLIPALSTQLWSDEHNAGFLDFLQTLPIKPIDLVIGKFLAAWVVCAIALLLSFPIVLVVNYLGSADNLAIASQVLASWLLAGSYLSVGCFICALTHQRLIIFSMTLGLLLTVSGLFSILDALEHQAPIWVIDSLTALSPFVRFSPIDHGTLTLHDCLYFISLMVAFLAATTLILNTKRS